MGGYYDEIEIEDMTWDEKARVFHYPCPCGDRFEISRAQLANYEDIATCPSCSLIIRVIYDPLDYEDYEEEEEDDDGEASSADESEPKEADDNEESTTAASTKVDAQLTTAIAQLNLGDGKKASDDMGVQNVPKVPIKDNTTAGDIRGDGDKSITGGGLQQEGLD